MTKQEIQQLRQYRTQIIRDAVAWKKPDRIGLVSMFQAWQILDAGYKLSDAMNDLGLLEKITREHIEKYNWDLVINDGTRNPFKLYEALGAKTYAINDELESINHDDFAYCEADEIKELSKDYYAFIWDKAMTKSFDFWDKNEIDLERIQKAADAKQMYMNYSFRMMNVFTEEYGLASFMAPYFAPQPVIENIYWNIRGIKGMSIDMRRDPKAFDDMVDALNALFYYPSLEVFRSLPAGPFTQACFESGTTFLCQNTLNRKQWDKYYWPYVKKVLDICVEKNYSYSIFSEGEVLRFRDNFTEYEKGVLNFMLEKDDVFEFRKQIPNACIMGGMDNYLLNSGTKQQCVDAAKRLIDELGSEGGYVMTQTKIGTFRNDGKAENIKAVNDFVLDYRL